MDLQRDSSLQLGGYLQESHLQAETRHDECILILLPKDLGGVAVGKQVRW